MGAIERRTQFKTIQARSRSVELNKREVLGNGIPEHILKSRPLAEDLFATSKPYSSQEYLAMAMNEGLNALEDGNYGIGAVYVLRMQGVEYVIGGHNKLRSDRSSHPHGEEDVIDGVEAIERGEEDQLSRILLKRKAPHKRLERILVTSLEPCMGCARRIATHKLDEVIIGAKDRHAGAMLDGRMEMLPGKWPKWMANIKKTVSDYENVDDPNYIDPKYIDLVWKTFLINVNEIDKEMVEHGLAAGKLHEVVAVSVGLLGLPLDDILE